MCTQTHTHTIKVLYFLTLSYTVVVDSIVLSSAYHTKGIYLKLDKHYKTCDPTQHSHCPKTNHINVGNFRSGATMTTKSFIKLVCGSPDVLLTFFSHSFCMNNFSFYLPLFSIKHL